MWLLHTKTLELTFFANSQSVRYAALSHVWEADDHRQPFREIQAIYSRCLPSGEDPREFVTAKLRNFLALAESEGYEWGWFDTACIDKTSSAELSEAINCMYRWYYDADVCYAYLSDVADHDNPFSPKSDFKNSRWHTRGWTLQELIAPCHVVFLSTSWQFIGTRVSLASVLEDTTGVDLSVLLRERDDWSEISVARRMSWASRRTTTRPEDRAYSLMGIFGVSMPIIYGEGGERAFERLQLEIIDLCPADQTIFAWGPIHPDMDIAFENLDSPFSFYRSISAEDPEAICSRLLASSPADFESSSNLRALDTRTYEWLFGTSIDTDYAITRTGAVLRLPLTLDCALPHYPRTTPIIHAGALACAADERSIVLLFLSRQDYFPTASSRPSSSSRPVKFDCIGTRILEDRVLRPTLFSKRHEPSRLLWERRGGFFRGVKLQFPDVLDPLFPSRAPDEWGHFRAEVSNIRLAEVRIVVSPGPTVPELDPKRAVNAEDNLWDGPAVGLELQIPPFTLGHLEAFGFVPGPPTSGSRSITDATTDSHSGLVFGVGRFFPGHTPSTPPIPWCAINFANPGRGERLTVTLGSGCDCSNATIDTDIGRCWRPWFEVTMSNVDLGSVVSTTKLLARDPEDDDSDPTIRAQKYGGTAPCRSLHLYPRLRGPFRHFVLDLDSSRAIHVRCRRFVTADVYIPSRPLPRPPPKYRVVMMIDLVGFEPGSSSDSDLDPLLVKGFDTLSVTAPSQASDSESEARPPPDWDVADSDTATAPMDHDSSVPCTTASGDGTAPARTLHGRLEPPLALLPDLRLPAQGAYTAGHFLGTGMRQAVAEWFERLGEADYTCGQLGVDEWGLGWGGVSGVQ